MLSQSKAENNLVKKWKEYEANLITYINSADNLILTHNDAVIRLGNPRHDQDSILKVKNLLDKLHTIQNNLDAYYKKLSLKSSETDTANKLVVDQVQLCKIAVISRTIQLNVILAGKYFYASLFVKSNYHIKSNLKNAYDTIHTAWNIRQMHAADLPEGYDPSIEESVQNITDHYHRYVCNQALPKDEINNLLAQARSEKDLDVAFHEFQLALDLSKSTNNYSQQFSIACEQSDKYARIMLDNNELPARIEDIDRRIKHLKKICTPLLFALELKFTKQLPGITSSKYEGLCLAMYRSAELFLSLSLAKCLSKEIERKYALLTDAKSYHELGDRLANKIKNEIIFSNFHPIGQSISDQIKIVELENIKLNQAKQDKENQEVELLKCMNEYNEKFQEILNSFYTRERIPRSKVRVNQYSRAANYVAIHDSSSSSSSAETKIEISDQLNNQPIYSYHYTFDLTKYTDLLRIATLNNDTQEQIHLNTSISDFYRIQAIRFIKKGSTHIDETIINLNYAMSYLLQAVNIIHASKIGIPGKKKYSFTKEEKWTHILLEETEILLNQTLAEQKDIEERFDASREDAKKYIIQKYGRSAWFKNDTFDQSALSLHARIRLETKNRVSLLEHMHDDIQQAQTRLNPQTEKVEKTEGKAVAIVEIHDNADTKPLVIEKACNSLNSRHTFFSTSQHIARQRSVSCDSLLDSKAITMRENIRKSY